MTKTHKLYFYDSGLAAYLLGILKPDDLNTHFARGNLFENMIVAELHKQQYHQGLRPHLYYWQESNGKEINLLWEQGTQLNIAEIKSAATINSAFFSNLNYFKKLSQGEIKNTFLIYGGSETQYRSEATVLAWYDAYQVFPF